jgi:hypothetical protein
MRRLVVPLKAEEIVEKAEIRRTLDGREYWRMMDVWLHTVLKRNDINTVSAKAWSITDSTIFLGPLPDEADLV